MQLQADPQQADALIPLRGTEDYYKRVLALDPDVHDFYRFFEAPGVQHCSGGIGGQPTATFDALVAWVEHGVAPDTIGVTFRSPFDDFGVNNTSLARRRILCPYPKKAVSDWSNSSTPTGSFFFVCRSSWTLVAMLTVPKAGATFLPFDALHPRERVDSIFQRKEARLILYSRENSSENQRHRTKCLVCQPSNVGRAVRFKCRLVLYQTYRYNMAHVDL